MTVVASSQGGHPLHFSGLGFTQSYPVPVRDCPNGWDEVGWCLALLTSSPAVSLLILSLLCQRQAAVCQLCVCPTWCCSSAGAALQGVAALPRQAKLLAKYKDHTVLSSVAVALNSKTFLYPSTDSLVMVLIKSLLQTFVHYCFVFLLGATNSVRFCKYL